MGVSLIWDRPADPHFHTAHNSKQANKSMYLSYGNRQLQPAQPPLSHSTQLKTSKQERISNMGTPNSNQHNPLVHTAPNSKQANKSVSLIWEPPNPTSRTPFVTQHPTAKSSKQKRISNMGTPNSKNQQNPFVTPHPTANQANKSVSLIWEPPTPTSTTPFFHTAPNSKQANKRVSLIWEPPTPTSTTPFVTQHPTANQANKSVSLIWEHPTPTTRTPFSHSTQLKTSKQKRISNMGTPNSNQHNPLCHTAPNCKSSNKSVSLIWEPQLQPAQPPLSHSTQLQNQANKSVSLTWEPPTPKTSRTPFSHSTKLQIKQTKAYL